MIKRRNVFLGYKREKKLADLKSYAGPLGAGDVVDGVEAAQRNAERLLADAKILLDNGRWPSALALAILSIEEKGKVTILKRLSLTTDPTIIAKVWKEYRSHRAKNAGWILPELAASGARTMTELASAVDAKGDHTNLLDSLKQISFYSDCLGAKNWSEPDEVVTESLARNIVQIAEIIWPSRPVTLREIELWIQIVSPAYDKPEMRQAVIQFAKAMNDEGLSDLTPEQMDAFMR